MLEKHYWRIRRSAKMVAFTRQAQPMSRIRYSLTAIISRKNIFHLQRHRIVARWPVRQLDLQGLAGLFPFGRL